MESIIIDILLVTAKDKEIGIIQNDHNVWESEYSRQDTITGVDIIEYDYVELTEVEVH